MRGQEPYQLKVDPQKQGRQGGEAKGRKGKGAQGELERLRNDK